MTGIEIKKAFDTMKRALAKELGITSGYYCNNKQIANRTATLLVCSTTPYEKEIERLKKIDANVQSYTSWSDEEKAQSHSRSLEQIAKYQQKLDKYCTRGIEILATEKALSESKAFKAFAEKFDKVTLTIEESNHCYYIRFHY